MANSTEMVFIIDKSGSMSGLEEDTIGGFNSNISQQRDLGEDVYVTTVLFDTNFNLLHDRVHISKVEKMTRKDYVPGGCTALCDALGDTINRIKTAHNYLKDDVRPNKTMFVVITDGEENSSKEFTSDKVKALIEEQKKQDWEFVFLGANMDAVETAKRYGINENRSVTYVSDRRGTENAWNTLGAMCSGFASFAEIADNWADKIKKDTKSRG